MSVALPFHYALVGVQAPRIRNSTSSSLAPDTVSRGRSLPGIDRRDLYSSARDRSLLVNALLYGLLSLHEAAQDATEEGALFELLGAPVQHLVVGCRLEIDRT